MAHNDAMPTIFAEGIEYTEHQATLIQRMSKEYLLIAAGFHEEEMRAELRESIEAFEKHMKGLIEGDMTLQLLPAPTPEIEKTLKKVAKMWKDFKPVLEPVAKGGSPTAEGIEKTVQWYADNADWCRLVSNEYTGERLGVKVG